MNMLLFCSADHQLLDTNLKIKGQNLSIHTIKRLYYVPDPKPFFLMIYTKLLIGKPLVIIL